MREVGFSYKSQKIILFGSSMEWELWHDFASSDVMDGLMLARWFASIGPSGMWSLVTQVKACTLLPWVEQV